MWPSLLPHCALPLDRVVLVIFAHGLACVLPRALPSHVHFPRGVFTHPPNRGGDDAGAYRRWRGDPGHAAQDAAKRGGADGGDEGADRGIFGPPDQPPEDELPDVSKGAEKGSGAQARGLLAASRVDQVFEVAPCVNERGIALLLNRDIITVRV